MHLVGDKRFSWLPPRREPREPRLLSSRDNTPESPPPPHDHQRITLSLPPCDGTHHHPSPWVQVTGSTRLCHVLRQKGALPRPEAKGALPLQQSTQGRGLPC